MGFQWDDENAALAVARWQAGDSAKQIGDRLGCSRNSVLGKVHRLGMAYRALPSAPQRSAPKPQRPKVQPRPAQPPFRPAAPVPVFVEAPGTATILTLGAFMCKWPIGEGLDVTFCGRRVDGFGPYCTGHAARAYTTSATSAKELIRSVRRYS